MLLANCPQPIRYSSPIGLDTGDTGMIVKRAIDQTVEEENPVAFKPADVGHRKPYTQGFEDTSTKSIILHHLKKHPRNNPVNLIVLSLLKRHPALE
ncbi:unnamed protein product [Ambrosiozyma monospora]|uniref:Unnamed protein product n=1 Tax=Ambrosiozyma monospora TaxID=43982 RepID=A0A9W7DFF9_AMBMO|nr:unnamed protein product [Ambrosiozyma monospora]